ncbi:hypothetical protein QBC41DRAFT_238767, partial [Cercophora samala]
EAINLKGNNTINTINIIVFRLTIINGLSIIKKAITKVRFKDIGSIKGTKGSARLR